MKRAFRKFAELVALGAASPWAFLAAVVVVVAWAVSGPAFSFSSRWELTINSFTTIITFLMVFIIQNTQNRDFKVIQVQIGELVRASQRAHRGLIDVQDFSDEDLQRIEDTLRQLRGKVSVDEIVQSLRRSDADALQPAGRAQ